MTRRQILVVSSDPSVCHLIGEGIGTTFAEISYASSPSKALDFFSKQEYCLTIMDFQMPETDGLDVEMLRIVKETKHTPILVIAPQLRPDEKVALFQAGASAIIEKPIDIAVCAAQATALVELYEDSDDKTKKCRPLTFGAELIISPLYRQVLIDGTQVDFTRTEFDLFFCLAQHPGQIWSRNQLYNYVWADTLGLDGEHTVKTHIGNLKKKLASLEKNYIQNSRGVGYKFVPPIYEEKM